MSSWLARTRVRAHEGAREDGTLGRRRALSALAVGAVAVAVSSTRGVAHATVMVEVPFDRLARESDAIVHGRVLRTGSRLVIDADGATPHTLTELDVYEPIKGDLGARVVIDEIGGEVQERGMWVTGTPRYRRGEECIVFLRRLPDGSFRTYAMAQGHFEVRPGVAGVAPTVVRDTSAMGMVSWANGVMQIQPGRVASMPLDAFLEYVRDLAESTAGAR